MFSNPYCPTFVCFQIYLGDIIDSVKTAAEGVKSHSSNVAAWMKITVTPSFKNMLPASPGPPPGDSQPSTSAAWAGRPVRNQIYFKMYHNIVVFVLTRVCVCVCVFYAKVAERNSLNETFAAPSTTLEWKTTKSGKAYHFKHCKHICVKVDKVCVNSWREMNDCTFSSLYNFRMVA